MSSDSSKIDLGLPQFPSNELTPQIYGELQSIYTAIRNLLSGVSRYSGVDAPPSDWWSQLTFIDTLLNNNHSRLYVQASTAISRGQAVNLFLSGGLLKARLAACTAAATMAHGVANSAASGAGTIIEVNYLRGTIDSIGGMTTGALYYLSNTAGAVQSARPATAGWIIQPVGLALSSNLMGMDIPLYYQQL